MTTPTDRHRPATGPTSVGPDPQAEAEASGWGVLYAGILIGMLVIAAAAVLTVMVLVRR